MKKPSAILNRRSPSAWGPAALSLLIHLFLIVALLLLFSWFSEPARGIPLRRGNIVVALPAESSAIQYLESSDVRQSPLIATNEKTLRMVDTSAPLLPPNLSQPSPLRGAVPVDTAVSTDLLTGAPDRGIANTSYRLSAEDLKLIEQDRRLINSRQPAGPAASIRLFGSGNITGQRFVFLLDCSASMGQGGLGVLSRARNELISTIDQLQAHHEFQIVAYQQRARSIAGRRMLQATADNKRLVGGFLDDLIAQGGTDHRHAIYFALSLDPDVIVLLTDGGLPRLHAGHIQAIGRSVRPQMQIHAFQFGSGPRQEADSFLNRLAEQHAGTYRYIDVRRWNRRVKLPDFQ